MGVQKYAFVADRFRIDGRKVKEIFVDESLIKIDGKEYWLWIAYEPNLDVYVYIDAFVKGKNDFFVCYHFLSS